MSVSDWNITAFFDQQLAGWELAHANYESLKKVKTRRFQFDTCYCDIQFNPERVRSVVANQGESKTVDNCFLCEKNRPKEQKVQPFDDRFDILCNPYPVFSRHLTIVSKLHTPQTIENELDTLLNIAHALPGFVVFYNGPHCGASAPEHLHFQAGISEEFPLYVDYESLKSKYGTQEHRSETLTHYQIDDTMRRFYILESVSISELSNYFYNRSEENVNLLAWYDTKKQYWILCVFERKKHRPDRFYVSGEQQLLISPASVEMAGKIITVREEDFSKVTSQDIKDIFDEVLK